MRPVALIAHLSAAVAGINGQYGEGKPQSVKTVILTIDATTTRTAYKASFVGYEPSSAPSSLPSSAPVAPVAQGAPAATHWGPPLIELPTDLPGPEQELGDPDDSYAAVTGLVNATRPSHRSHSINTTREFSFNHTSASHLSTLWAQGTMPVSRQ